VGGHPVFGAEGLGSGPRLLEQQRPVGTARDTADDRQRHAFPESERGSVSGRHDSGALVMSGGGVLPLGGAPVYPHHEARGIDNSWRLLCQFRDRGEAADVAPDDPFCLNLGYGSGFVFVSADHLEGRFIGDCS
jgi:hypothetical protein